MNPPAQVISGDTLLTIAITVTIIAILFLLWGTFAKKS